MEWSRKADGKDIFWLNGMAGTGKSTIALTIADQIASCNRLGASFFFSRNEGDLANGRKFFTGLTSQLASNAKLANELACLKALKHYIHEAIAKYPLIDQKHLREQWKKLLFEPLYKLKSSSLQAPVLVFVIDALD